MTSNPQQPEKRPRWTCAVFEDINQSYLYEDGIPFAMMASKALGDAVARRLNDLEAKLEEAERERVKLRKARDTARAERRSLEMVLRERKDYIKGFEAEARAKLEEVEKKALLAMELRQRVQHAAGLDGVFDEVMGFADEYDALTPTQAQGEAPTP